MSRASRKSEQEGFTIIELSLAMAFIAMLLLAIALLTSQISSVYNKGLTLKSVNDAGLLVSRDLQQTLNTSIPAQVIFRNGDGGGRICANNVVYAWNYAGRISNGTYGFYGRNRLSTGTEEVRLVRFTGGVSFCTAVMGVYPLIPNDPSARLTQLLNGGDASLVLHPDITFSEAAVNGDDLQRIYSISFILGTAVMPGIGANGCKAPTSKVDDEYCAVNRFDFTARAGNRQSSEGYGG